jgi:hypothetical protein
MSTQPTLPGMLTRRSPFGLVAQAHAVLADAEASDDPADRFRLAHLAALRAAAAVVADRGGPVAGRRKLVSVWPLVQRVAPDLAHWAGYFAAGAPTRAAAEAGASSAVSPRAADDEVQAARQFLAEVQNSLGLLAA